MACNTDVNYHDARCKMPVDLLDVSRTLRGGELQIANRPAASTAEIQESPLSKNYLIGD
ncbi:uncharacterized protein H6S33_006001 [Morchella sextelata]|uniref:uncharacterized protein n=1 Tax=Morchella sextelata TaxID=1174677 RepID=UPI001D04D123|nr:uncharacterized protein H6S33_006001 [Morchella sextelata]KAH0614115.1 hypothetical protein H6S33_006001 [Morchella sextelata]